MLNQTTSYLARQILIATLLITFMFVVIAVLWSALPLLSSLSRGMGLDVFAWLVLLAMPRLLPVLLPLSAALAVIFAYYRAQLDSELVVMRATGLSNLTLARPALWVALFLTLTNSLMAFHLGPQAFRAFKEAQFFERENLAALAIQSGKFRALKSGTMFYVRSRTGDSTLNGILFQDERDPKKTQTWMARFGQLTDTPEGPRLVLRDGNLQEFEHATGRINVLYFESYTLDISNLARDLEERYRQPEERSMTELFTKSEPEIDAKQVRRFRAEGHYRIVSALFVGSVMLVAVAAMLVGPFNRRGQMWRVGLAFSGAALILLGTFLLRSLLARNPATAPIIYALVLVPSIGAFCLLLWSDRSKFRQPLRRS
jgi:lipopolysaccharide export system permease protein